MSELLHGSSCVTLLADSLCVGGEASADYWST